MWIRLLAVNKVLMQLGKILYSTHAHPMTHTHTHTPALSNIDQGMVEYPESRENGDIS